MKSFIFSVVCCVSFVVLMHISTNEPNVIARKELKVEVSINGTPYWMPIQSNDVIHVIVDNNQLTAVKSYSNEINN